MARSKSSATGVFRPKNPKKVFSGGKDIIYRSSWEFDVMRRFDESPSVITWASEPISIPYYNPVKRTHTVYVPDFIVVYADNNGRKTAMMLEIKPAKEVPFLMEGRQRLSTEDRVNQAINLAKWQAAAKFCKKRKMLFKVWTEYDIYKEMKRKLLNKSRKK